MPPEPRCLSPDPAPMALARSLHAPRRRIYTTASTVTSTGLRSPSRRDAARLHPTPPPAVPQCPFPAVCGDTSHLSARCVAACAVHVHLALRRLLVLPLPAHRPHRGASRRVRRRPRVATAAHAWTQAWRLGTASAAPPLAPTRRPHPPWRTPGRQARLLQLHGPARLWWRPVAPPRAARRHHVRRRPRWLHRRRKPRRSPPTRTLR